MENSRRLEGDYKMNSMVHFLGSNPAIKHIVMVLGADGDSARIWEICRNMQLDTLSVFVPTQDQQKKVISELSVFAEKEGSYLPGAYEVLLTNELEHYQKNDGITALVLENPTDNEKAIALTALKPDYLAAEIKAERMSAFLIWEAYRENAGHICIVSRHAADYEEVLNEKKADKSDISECAEGRIEVLNWEKNDQSDIELSVIFPMYNIAAYLPKCIESVTAWKAKYVEYLFVDDGSPDNCAEIVEAYAAKDSRIKLLRKKNGGCASARQYGLDRAKGRYVAFIDPDDYIDESMHRKLLSRALTGSYEISYCGYKELYESTGTVQEIDDVLGKPYCEGTSDPKEIDKLIAFRRIAIWRGIYLKDLIDRNGIHFYEDLRRFDDLPFKVETFASAKSVVAIPEYLYYYRMARPGQDVAADDERLYVHFAIFEYLDRFLAKKKNPDQLDFLQIVKLHTHQWALEKMKPEFVAEYCKRARNDVASNLSFAEGLYAVSKYSSKKSTLYYIAIYHHWVWMVRRLIKYHKKPDKKREKVLSQLEVLGEKRFK